MALLWPYYLAHCWFNRNVVVFMPFFSHLKTPSGVALGALRGDRCDMLGSCSPLVGGHVPPRKSLVVKRMVLLV